METSRRQFLGGLTAAAVATVLPLAPAKSEWLRMRTVDGNLIAEDIWNGDLIVDSRNGRLLGVFWNGHVWAGRDRVVWTTDEEANAWTTMSNYLTQRA